MKKHISIAFVVASLFAFAAPAFADETTTPAKAAAPAKAEKKAATSTSKDEKSYGYTFEDDPLNSGVQGTTGFVLRVRPAGTREGLLKPRISFVPEMLKSVEGL
jgi:hypothetical protein